MNLKMNYKKRKASATSKEDKMDLAKWSRGLKESAKRSFEEWKNDNSDVREEAFDRKK